MGINPSTPAYCSGPNLQLSPGRPDRTPRGAASAAVLAGSAALLAEAVDQPLPGKLSPQRIFREDHVSLMTRKDTRRNRAVGDVGQKVGDAGQKVASMITQMGPVTGSACRQGAEGAARWAAPQVQAARSWAEPQVQAARISAAQGLEQAGLVVRDKIAPTVSDALVEASRRLAGPQPQPSRLQRLSHLGARRWPQIVAGAAMLAAVGSAIAAVMLKRQAEADLEAGEDAPENGVTPMPPGATRASGGPYAPTPADRPYPPPRGEGPYAPPPREGPAGRPPRDDAPGPDDFLP
jgi:hypothetical protein